MPQFNKGKQEDVNIYCNWLDLQTLGSQLVMLPKNLPIPFLGIVGQYPSEFKFSRSHVDILWF